jgi:hypothetical protein
MFQGKNWGVDSFRAIEERAQNFGCSIGDTLFACVRGEE